MTLTEYLNQKDPARMPQVILQPNEYILGHFFGAPGQRIAEVFLPLIGHCYCVHEGGKRLYTINRHGNSKSASCFYLP